MVDKTADKAIGNLSHHTSDNEIRGTSQGPSQDATSPTPSFQNGVKQALDRMTEQLAQMMETSNKFFADVSTRQTLLEDRQKKTKAEVERLAADYRSLHADIKKLYALLDERDKRNLPPNGNVNTGPPQFKQEHNHSNDLGSGNSSFVGSIPAQIGPTITEAKPSPIGSLNVHGNTKIFYPHLPLDELIKGRNIMRVVKYNRPHYRTGTAEEWEKWLFDNMFDFASWFNSDHSDMAWRILHHMPLAYVPKYSNPNDRVASMCQLLDHLKVLAQMEAIMKIPQMQFTEDILLSKSEVDKFKEYITTLFTSYDVDQYDQLCNSLKMAFNAIVEIGGTCHSWNISSVIDLFELQVADASSSDAVKKSMADKTRKVILEKIDHAYQHKRQHMAQTNRQSY